MTICSSDPQIDPGRVNKVWTRLFPARLISKQPEKNWDNMIYHMTAVFIWKIFTAHLSWQENFWICFPLVMSEQGIISCELST